MGTAKINWVISTTLLAIVVVGLAAYSINQYYALQDLQRREACAVSWLDKAATLHDLHLKDPTTTTKESQLELMDQIMSAYECLSGHKPKPEHKMVTGYANITPQQLYSMLEKKDFLLINVHIPYEGEIERTDLFIPYNEIERNLDKLPKDKNAKIVVYCMSDRMSNIAARKLLDLSYTDVSNLEGGMIAWQQSGYKLIHK